MISNLEVSRWRRRPTVLLLALVLLLVCYFGLIPRPRFAFHRLPPESVTQDLKHLRKHIRTSRFTYAQRLVQPRPYIGTRPDLAVGGGVEPLFPSPETLENARDSPVTGYKSRAGNHPPPALPPLELYVPESPKVNTAIISFGVATSVSRLQEASLQFVHWLKGSGAPLHVISAPDDHASEMQAYMRGLGIDATIQTSKDRTPLAFFSLIKRLYETRQPHTQWLAIIDDDTFVPSLPTLVDHLSTVYRADREVMVSALSDNIEQIESWGMQTFGGGGIFISVPLAARLTKPAIWEKCLQSAKGLGQGDQIVTRCLNNYTDVRPMFDPALHQMDIGETPAGYFESGRRMLTVHHWRTWFKVDIPRGSLVARACGAEGLFQRWSFPKSNMVLSNGYSIAEYRKGLSAIDFAAVEKTWEGDEAKFLHKVGPLRKAIGKSDKVSYGLVDSEVVDGYFVRQTYLHRGERLVDDDEPEMDGVLELLWLL